MAKIVGPLHSDDASGLYGGEKTGVVYSKWRNKRYTRTYALDVANPRAAKQLPNRALVRCLNSLWKAMSDEGKAYWASYGAMWELPGWQSFVKYNLRQAQVGWGPQVAVNTEHTESPSAPTALTAETVAPGCVLLTWHDSDEGWTSLIHAGGTDDFTVAMQNLAFAGAVTDSADLRQATVQIAPGTYYFRARSASTDGSVGAPTTAVGPIVVE